MSGVIFKATVLHEGWDMDNEITVFGRSEKNGGNYALGSNHGIPCIVTEVELNEYIAKTEASLASLKEALKLISPAR